MAKKYIDADLLRAEIEKRLKNVRDYMNGGGMKYKGPRYYKMQGKESVYDSFLSIIDSLQQEQSEVDLDEEIETWISTHIKVENGGIHQVNTDELAKTVKEWGKCIARYFYGLGLNAKEENK